MTPRLNVLLLGILIVLGVPCYWLFLNTDTTGSGRKAVDIAQLRRLAGSIEGAAPVEVRYEQIAWRSVAGNLLAAGSGVRPTPYAIRAFELVLPNESVISIDRGTGAAIARENDLSGFDPVAQATVDRAFAAATLRLTLAPGPEHSGQAEAPAGFGSGLPNADRTGPKGPYGVAPGVVVIPTPGVGAGTRMIYVRLAGGRELLFAGDVAPVQASWQQLRPPARIVTSYLHPGDREEIAGWLRTVRALKEAAPSLEVVPGHDPFLPRWIKRGFMATPGEPGQMVR